MPTTAAATNHAAFLVEAGKPLEVREASMPVPGPGEIVVRNSAVAINPLDWHMVDAGVFVQQWPAIIGCDVAGEVYAVGDGVSRFKEGDRVLLYNSWFKTFGRGKLQSKWDRPYVVH